MGQQATGLVAQDVEVERFFLPSGMTEVKSGMVIGRFMGYQGGARYLTGPYACLANPVVASCRQTAYSTLFSRIRLSNSLKVSRDSPYQLSALILARADMAASSTRSTFSPITV